MRNTRESSPHHFFATHTDTTPTKAKNHHQHQRVPCILLGFQLIAKSEAKEKNRYKAYTFALSLSAKLHFLVLCLTLVVCSVISVSQRINEWANRVLVTFLSLLFFFCSRMANTWVLTSDITSKSVQVAIVVAKLVVANVAFANAIKFDQKSCFYISPSAAFFFSFFPLRLYFLYAEYVCTYKFRAKLINLFFAPSFAENEKKWKEAWVTTAALLLDLFFLIHSFP